MKIRITGLYEEIAQALNALNAVPGLDVLEISGPYPNRGASRLVRIYAEVQFTEQCDVPMHDDGNSPGSHGKSVTRPVRIKEIGEST